MNLWHKLLFIKLVIYSSGFWWENECRVTQDTWRILWHHQIKKNGHRWYKHMFLMDLIDFIRMLPSYDVSARPLQLLSDTVSCTLSNLSSLTLYSWSKWNPVLCILLRGSCSCTGSSWWSRASRQSRWTEGSPACPPGSQGNCDDKQEVEEHRKRS